MTPSPISEGKVRAKVDKDEVVDRLTAFAVPVSAGVAGHALASAADFGHVWSAASAVLVALIGLLSVVLRGRLRLRELKQQHETEAMKLRTDRMARKLRKAGIDPDTEE